MLKIILLWILRLTLALVLFSIALVVIYRFVPVLLTPLMVIRVVEGAVEGRWIGIDKTWVSYEEISPNVMRAVIASEDTRFLQHTGIDWEAVREAERRNERTERRTRDAAARGKLLKTKRLYGASTITMQTAKNTFLFPSRTYLRKALEAYFTYLMEFLWDKRRILEVYVNVIETGDGIYGVEAAATRFFGKHASKLTAREAALVAAVLPNPRRWSPLKPSLYIQKRAAAIQAHMNVAIPK
jgi:monofunctional glycosyltransferase